MSHEAERIATLEMQVRIMRQDFTKLTQAMSARTNDLRSAHNALAIAVKKLAIQADYSPEVTNATAPAVLDAQDAAE